MPTKPKKCPKCRKRPPRAEGQAYCRVCHAKASRIHRARRREELERLRAYAAAIKEPALV